jgi:hypothetical protein
MMHGREKSDLAIVAAKPTNKAGRPAAESVEPRVGAKGSADQQSTHRAQYRDRVSQALDHARQTAKKRFAVIHPRWEPYVLIGLVRICAGGAQQWASLPQTHPDLSGGQKSATFEPQCAGVRRDLFPKCV